MRCIRREVNFRKKTMQGFLEKDQPKGDMGFPHRKMSWLGLGVRGQSQVQFVWQKAQKPAKAQTWEQSNLNSQSDVLNKYLTARADPSKVSESMRDPIRAVVRMNESGRQNRLKVGKPPRMFLQSSGWEEMMGNRRVALRMGKKGHMWETLWPPLVNGTCPPTPWAKTRLPSTLSSGGCFLYRAPVPPVPEVGSAFSWILDAISQLSILHS